MRRTFFSWVIAAGLVLAPSLAMGDDREDKATAEQIATILRDSGERCRTIAWA